jgi:hypothetical protein
MGLFVRVCGDFCLVTAGKHGQTTHPDLTACIFGDDLNPIAPVLSRLNVWTLLTQSCPDWLTNAFHVRVVEKEEWNAKVNPVFVHPPHFMGNECIFDPRSAVLVAELKVDDRADD